jgi:soluble lytic murein transglycosylase
VSRSINGLCVVHTGRAVLKRAPTDACHSKLSARNSEHSFFRPPAISVLILLIALGVVWAGERQTAALPAALEKGREPYSRPVEEALKGLAQGIGFYQNVQFTAALDSLPGDDAARRTALRDYFLSYRAKANLALDRGAEALSLFRQLQNDFPNSPLLSDAAYGEALAQLKLHDAESARGILANPALPRNSQTLFYQARAEEEAGETAKAVDLYLRLYTDFAGSQQSSQAQERLIYLSPKSITGTTGFGASLRRSENLLGAGMNKEAQALLAKFARVAAPDKLSADRRLVLLASAETNLGRASAVLPYLSKVGTSDPAIHARALYLIAVCQRRLKSESAFLQTRDEAIRLYPESPYTERILYSVATYFDVADRPAEARDAYRRLAESFPKGPNTERTLWKLAFYSYIDKKYEEALQGFWKCLQAYPNSRSASAPLFWMGRCCDRLGDPVTAAVFYRRAAALSNNGYYGRLAAQAGGASSKTETGRQVVTGLDLALVAQTVSAIQPSDAAIPPPTPAAAQVIERAYQLAFAGLADLAQTELRWGIRQYPQEKALSYVSSRLYAAKNEYDMVFTTLRRAFPDYDVRAVEELPTAVWQMLFPFEHWSVVKAQAQKNNIDPGLVLGLIRQESAFNENARSRANARGLMQLLPSTGRALARQSGVRYTPTRLYRAETNILLGIQHLGFLLRQYGGREELALAAYNAGDSRVEQWMGKFGNVDMAEFVERIPFAETRGYVKQVLTNKSYYSILKPSLPDYPELGKSETREQPKPASASTAAPAKSKSISKKTATKQPVAKKNPQRS